MLVILDNGHGKNTPGKRSPVWKDGSQLFEWEFNRKIVKEIKYRLDLLGIENTILVPEDDDISLGERVRRVNKICVDKQNTLLLSIHGNAGGGTGWEAWTSVSDDASDHYVKYFYNSAKQYLKDWKIREDYSDGDPDWESQFYILKNSKCPAILTENLFMDNEKDCKFMLSSEGIKTLAALHVDAIITINDELNKTL